MGSRTVTGTTVVPAAPSAVFAILTDPRRHPEIDGSSTVQHVIEGPERLVLDSRFAMGMKMGTKYRITNRVVEYEPDRLIAWRHIGLHRWRYELAPVEGGTRVTETWDCTRYPAPVYAVLRLAGFADKARQGIDGTLVRLTEVTTGLT